MMMMRGMDMMVVMSPSGCHGSRRSCECIPWPMNVTVRMMMVSGVCQWQGELLKVGGIIRMIMLMRVVMMADFGAFSPSGIS